MQHPLIEPTHYGVGSIVVYGRCMDKQTAHYCHYKMKAHPSEYRLKT